MTAIYAEKAWLPQGWADKVLFEINSAGNIETISMNCQPEFADSKVDVLIPAMANIHSHAFQRAMAGLAEYRADGDDNFWSWRETMYAFARNIDRASLKAIASQLYGEMLAAGYSAVAEFHYLHHLGPETEGGDPYLATEAIVQAAEESGIGLTLCPVLYLQGGFGGQSLVGKQKRFFLELDAYCRFLERLHKELGARGHQLGMAFHSLRAVPPEALKEALQFWRRLNPQGPVHIHIAEQTAEVEACLAWSGKRPVRWLLDDVGIDENWCLVHATHLEVDEVRDMAASGAVAGLCPSTEANLGDGFFDMLGYQDASGRWAIGSDSHISVSPVEELRLLEYGARLRYRKRNLIATETQPHVGAHLWKQALLGGQRPLGRAHQPMTPGARADFVALDSAHPILYGREGDSLIDTWIFSGNRPLVHAVMAGGKWVVRHGKHVHTEDMAHAYRQAIAAVQGNSGEGTS